MFSFKKRNIGKKELELGYDYHDEQRLSQAEQWFRESVQQREKVLGAEHVNTLWSKYWLALTLYDQEKYAEAELLLRQSAQQREKVLGAEHVDNAALKWVQDMVISPQKLRPTVASLMASIASAGQKEDGNEAFCGICCASPDDFLSDFDELERDS